MNDAARAAAGAIAKSINSKSVQILTGLISGMVADGQLNDLEIQFLNTWLTENSGVTNSWPGSAVARHVREILEDGVITNEEREHLLKTLQGMAGNDFTETGAVTPCVADLPYDHDHIPAFSGVRVCLTGEFLYGTRSACEAISTKIGAIPVASLSRKVSYLIVGTHVSPAWLTESYGRKIMQAVELKSGGHPIRILPERRWIEHLG